jgi:hypothetical protein
MLSRRSVQGILSLLVLFPAASIQAEVSTYCCDAAAEAAYLADLAGLAVQPDLLGESFEDGPWIAARTVPQPSVSNLGITWSRPDAGLRTSTGGGDAHDGSYIMFTYDVINGLPTHAIPDGYRLVADGSTLYGVGGWFRGTDAKLAFTVDGDPQRVDFTGPEATVREWKFLGFIETLGFGTLEIRTADEVGNEINIFFSDDFTVGIDTGTPPPPLPAGSLQFSASSFDVAESGTSVAITVTRTGGSAGAISVDYVTGDGTATAGSDYAATAGTLNFADGETSRSLSIVILDDTIYEGDEGFSVSLSNVAGGAGLGTPATASVTITEDDPPPPAGSLQLSASGFSVAESGASVAVTVTRTGGSAGAVSVDYATSDGSATAGSDYSSTAGTLHFADGETSQSFSIVILDDTLYEGDESFSVSLSNVAGGASPGTPATENVTITEDDPPPAQDSNGDGLSDADAIALGLDPNDPDGDTDNDGISDILEVGNDVANPLDGDVDGVIDALEPGTDAADAMVASGVPLDGGGTLVITTAAGETLARVSAAAATGGPTGVNFPFGMVSYTTTAPAGGAVTVQMEFSVDLPASLALYKVDNAGVYRELAAGLWTRVSARRLDLTLTDGDPLTDLDGVANASIDDPIAPAEFVPVASSDSGGGGGCVMNSVRQKDPIWLLLTLAALVYASRRAKDIG